MGLFSTEQNVITTQKCVEMHGNTRESLIINLKMAHLHDLAVKTSAGTFA